MSSQWEEEFTQRLKETLTQMSDHLLLFYKQLQINRGKKKSNGCTPYEGGFPLSLAEHVLFM